MNLQEFKMNVEIAFKPHKVAYVAIWDKIFRVYVHIHMYGIFRSFSWFLFRKLLIRGGLIVEKYSGNPS